MTDKSLTALIEKEGKYKCSWCGTIQTRTSNLLWIKSWCDKYSRDVRMMLVKQK